MDQVAVVIPGCVYVYKGWLDSASLNAIQGMLEFELASYLQPHRGFKGWLDHNRLTARFGLAGVSYDYGSRTYKLSPFGEQLDALRRTVQGEVGHTFNVAYANKYLNGNASLPRHSDILRLSQLGQQPVIASVSFGEARPLQFWRSSAPRDRSHMVEAVLEQGDLCIMRGRSQLDWLHSVPKQPIVSGARLSVTFRRHDVV